MIATSSATAGQPATARVLRVKRGDVPQMAEVLDEIAAVQREIEARLTDGRTPLPAEPDWAKISAWSVDAHRRHWGWE
ncbi:hypothetical protein [Actinophytocola sp.]|uniref:hypothetical protein n=1 Tax=Actinophytocola sp. TaxID=1872138 RepID=UPI002D7F6ED6|nr:hypothetical protein [Actinophytocola sp.]HET9139395.1 hypothetical protein [Actinophytocola sp.]HEU5111303.1 hypothetical protein [Micromonosporaceae bacterium]